MLFSTSGRSVSLVLLTLYIYKYPIQIRCSCCWKCSQKPMDSMVLEDNCCGCNFAAFTKMCHLPDTYVVYVTYHVDVGEIPFLVALDYSQKAIVISIRGTLSLEVCAIYFIVVYYLYIIVWSKNNIGVVIALLERPSPQSTGTPQKLEGFAKVFAPAKRLKICHIFGIQKLT